MKVLAFGRSGPGVITVPDHDTRPLLPIRQYPDWARARLPPLGLSEAINLVNARVPIRTFRLTWLRARDDQEGWDWRDWGERGVEVNPVTHVRTVTVPVYVEVA